MPGPAAPKTECVSHSLAWVVQLLSPNLWHKHSGSICTAVYSLVLHFGSHRKCCKRGNAFLVSSNKIDESVLQCFRRWRRSWGWSTSFKADCDGDSSLIVRIQHVDAVLVLRVHRTWPCAVKKLLREKFEGISDGFFCRKSAIYSTGLSKTSVDSSGCSL